MKLCLGVVATPVLSGCLVSTHAVAAGGGGTTGSHAGAIAAGGGLGGGRVVAGSRGPVLIITRDGRLYAVPLFAGSRFTTSTNHYSMRFNAMQSAAPQANNYYFGSYATPSQGGPGGTPYGGSLIPAAGTGTQVAASCGVLAGSLTDVPVDQLRLILHPTDDQHAQLDRLKAASLEAKNVLEAACLPNRSVSPVDRLEAAEKQSLAITHAAQILRPPLEKLYASLSDDQKASLNDTDPQPQNVSLAQAQDQANDNRPNLTNLKVGARVRLRSGGPMMAVVSVSGTEITCVWFDAAGQAETATFPAASLM